jgi:uncharacterized membrane protein YdbT with pleckstrin-like domain
LPCMINILIAWWIWYVVITYLTANIFRTSMIIIWILILWMIYASIMRRYIDYIMDYCIVTPEEVIFVEQTGIFNRQIRTLDVTKIKSISVHKKNFIHSLFNNWAIIFMSDWDEAEWEITLENIYDPEWEKAILQSIIIKH